MEAFLDKKPDRQSIPNFDNPISTHCQLRHCCNQKAQSHYLKGPGRYRIIPRPHGGDLYKNNRGWSNRSGTGKTTCLVFNLVGKFLVSNAGLEQGQLDMFVLR